MHPWPGPPSGSGANASIGVMPQLDFLVLHINVGHSKFGYRKF